MSLGKIMFSAMCIIGISFAAIAKTHEMELKLRDPAECDSPSFHGADLVVDELKPWTLLRECNLGSWSPQKDGICDYGDQLIRMYMLPQPQGKYTLKFYAAGKGKFPCANIKFKVIFP